MGRPEVFRIFPASMLGYGGMSLLLSLGGKSYAEFTLYAGAFGFCFGPLPPLWMMAIC